MFERFSANARQVVVQAQEQARMLRHNYIGTEHILLGVLRLPDSVGGRALSGVGVSFSDVRERVLAVVGEGKKSPSGHIPFTPRAKKVLELSLREALQLGHNFIGTEHIVLGLVREGEGVGAQVLLDAGVDLAGLREVVAGLAPPVSGATGSRLRRLLRRRSPWGGVGSGEGAEEGEVRTTAAADVSLEQARQLAGDAPVGSHHLLLAALGNPSSAAAKALTGLGIDLGRAIDALRTVDVTGTADEAADEAGRRALVMRLNDERLVLEASDPVLLDEARKTFASLPAGGGSPPSGVLEGSHPDAGRLADVWLAWREALVDIGMRSRARERAGGEGAAGGEQAGGASAGGAAGPGAA
jgi:Clp amino terminal domain, pathogenicity island component